MPTKKEMLRWLATAWIISNLIMIAGCTGGTAVSIVKQLLGGRR